MTRKISLIILALLMSFNLSAEIYHNDTVEVSDVWTRPKTKSSTAGGVFLTLKNISTQDETLISASSPIAARVELHDHMMENDIMKMREVATIDVSTSEPTKLQPGGLHVMLFGIKKPLSPGKTFPLTLNFKNGKSITVTVDVKKMMHDPKKPCCHNS